MYHQTKKGIIIRGLKALLLKQSPLAKQLATANKACHCCHGISKITERCDVKDGIAN